MKMGLYTKINGCIKKFQNFLYMHRMQYGEKQFIKKNKCFYKNMKWTEEQDRVYEEYWKKNYGQTFPKYWSKLYHCISGVYHEDYFPEILYTTKIEPLINPMEYGEVFSNKSLLPILYGGIDDVCFPRTIVVNNFGRYSDGDFRLLTEIQAIECLKNIGSVVFKATTDSGGGKSVQMVNIQNGKDIKTGMTVEELFKKYDHNFIVQERITASAELQKFGPTSLNTIRLITYLTEDHVSHAPIALRMGIKGMEIDNLTSGGLCVGIADDGRLKENASNMGYANSLGQFVKEHPDTHVVFKDFVIPQIPKMIELAYKMHLRTPQVGMISWDLSINQEGKIVLIEANYCNQSLRFPQVINGEPMFGEDTAYMLSLVRGK